MPYNVSGNYSLTAGYRATPLTTIQSGLQHNTVLDDIAQALNMVLLRDGRVPVSGDMAFVATKTLTLGRDAASALEAVTKQQLDAALAGQLGLVPVGASMDYHDTVAPPGWVFPFGQNLSRTTYAALFAKWNTRYGAGDGSTTFGCLDKRGRPSYPADNMGGAAANRLQVSTTITTTNGSATATVGSAAGLGLGMYVLSANVPAGTTIADISGTTITLSTGTGVTAGSAVTARFSDFSDPQALGAAGGTMRRYQFQKEVGIHNHTASVSDPGHYHTQYLRSVQSNYGGGPSDSAATALTTINTLVAYTGIGVGVNFNASPLPMSILPPGIICNHIVFAGA